MKSDTKEVFGIIFICILGAIMMWALGYATGTQVHNTDCPQGYKCEKIQGNCYIENKDSITILWNGKYDVFEYEKGLEREIIKDILAAHLNNGTQIPRCSEEGR